MPVFIDNCHRPAVDLLQADFAFSKTCMGMQKCDNTGSKSAAFDLTGSMLQPFSAHRTNPNVVTSKYESHKSINASLRRVFGKECKCKFIINNKMNEALGLKQL